MFVVIFDCIQKVEDLQAFLSGYESCPKFEFEGIREKAFVWFGEYLNKYGYSLTLASTYK